MTDALEDMTPNQRRALRKGLAALETMADLWAAEVRLSQIAERIASVPDADERARRIAAMIHLGFVEGAYRHHLDHKNDCERTANATGKTMTPEQIVKLAAEHRIEHDGDYSRNSAEMTRDLVAFAQAVAAEARAEAIEECAKVADGFSCGTCGMDGKSANAIRALLNTGEKT